ncbi:MAG: MarR family transcriptional regulator [Methanobrevibacter sp.]|uniref:MarR family transcriptional regulator n=1 Tax=Methanobrevibacter sp. TaxID=66852 RepID=UPI0025E826C6|nr:MarR family transcriptional regulator [Methanobrevibacter sp.]MBQ8017255.1 MarR family transcriptional regulator [Methanobrevibacter sp.]
MDEKEFFLILGFVKISPYRTNTLKSIGNTLKMPSEIARENNLKTSQVSAALIDLKKKNLVLCVNEEVRKGRLYKCTPLGLQILEKI